MKQMKNNPTYEETERELLKLRRMKMLAKSLHFSICPHIKKGEMCKKYKIFN